MLEGQVAVLSSEMLTGEESLELKHTLNAEQIQWFKAGSALNLLRTKKGS